MNTKMTRKGEVGKKYYLTPEGKQVKCKPEEAHPTWILKAKPRKTGVGRGNWRGKMTIPVTD